MKILQSGIFIEEGIITVWGSRLDKSMLCISKVFQGIQGAWPRIMFLESSLLFPNLSRIKACASLNTPGVHHMCTLHTLGVMVIYLRLENFQDIFTLAQCNLINVDNTDTDPFYDTDFHAESITLQ